MGENEARTKPAEDALDSAAFLRCARCKHAAEVNREAGTLLCERHNMRCDVEQGEIPDDCAQYEPEEP